jgi:serine/threonine protein phosphatase PrpC
VKHCATQVAQRSGLGSRARNEDCLAVERRGAFWRLVLSDGAGGHAGDRAARLVVGTPPWSSLVIHTQKMFSKPLAEAPTSEDWLDAMMAAKLARAEPHQDNYSTIDCWIDEPLEAGDSASEAETWPPRPRHATNIRAEARPVLLGSRHRGTRTAIPAGRRPDTRVPPR